VIGEGRAPPAASTTARAGGAVEINHESKELKAQAYVGRTVSP
jgi:hypothetical protein